MEEVQTEGHTREILGWEWVGRGLIMILVREEVEWICLTGSFLGEVGISDLAFSNKGDIRQRQKRNKRSMRIGRRTELMWCKSGRIYMCGRKVDIDWLLCQSEQESGISK